MPSANYSLVSVSPVQKAKRSGYVETNELGSRDGGDASEIEGDIEYLFFVFIVVVWSQRVELLVAWAERHVGNHFPMLSGSSDRTDTLSSCTCILSSSLRSFPWQPCRSLISMPSQTKDLGLPRSPKYVVVMASMHEPCSANLGI